jgi:hypothetical protein
MKMSKNSTNYKIKDSKEEELIKENNTLIEKISKVQLALGYRWDSTLDRCYEGSGTPMTWRIYEESDFQNLIFMGNSNELNTKLKTIEKRLLDTATLRDKLTPPYGMSNILNEGDSKIQENLRKLGFKNKELNDLAILIGKSLASDNISIGLYDYGQAKTIFIRLKPFFEFDVYENYSKRTKGFQIFVDNIPNIEIKVKGKPQFAKKEVLKKLKQPDRIFSVHIDEKNPSILFNKFLKSLSTLLDVISVFSDETNK